MVGIICVDKPEEFTSFDVVAKMRGILREKRVGHGGTLDPMATGVLPIFVGRATKALDLMPIQDKTYIAGFTFGKATDTQDDTGTVIEEKEANFTKYDVENILVKFVGEVEQLPPMYSAVSVNGVRLYDLARKGVEVKRDTRKITIHTLKLLEFDPVNQSGKIEVYCSKGTYVRTLIHDMGHCLGSCGMMTTLRRTQTLGYDIDQCYTLEQLQKLKDDGEIESVVLPIQSAFATYSKIYLSQKQAKMFCNGVKLDIGKIKNVAGVESFTVWNDDCFLGLARADYETSELIMEKLFYLDK